jgi:hypothetical protein
MHTSTISDSFLIRAPYQIHLQPDPSVHLLIIFPSLPGRKNARTQRRGMEPPLDRRTAERGQKLINDGRSVAHGQCLTTNERGVKENVIGVLSGRL